MRLVTLPSQKLKAWQKLRLEGKIWKWLDAQRVTEPQINARSGVSAEALLSVSQAEIIFLWGANTSMKINDTIAGDSATGKRKLTARQWAELIGFCGVETQKQAQKIESKSKRLVVQRMCAPLWSPQSMKNKLMFTANPTGCGLATMLRKTSGNADSPTDRWQTWKNWAGHIYYGFHPLDRTGNLGYGGGWSRKTTRINYITPEALKNFRKKKRLPPTSYDTANWVLLTYSLFLKTFFGMKAPQKRGVDVVQAGLLNMSEQE